MKQLIAICVFLLMSFLLKAQVAFTTVVPLQPVTAGSSFQVQYVIEGAEIIDAFKQPVFENFRLVSGPNMYTGTSYSGSGSKKVRNIIFTLEATRPGRFMIPGTSVELDRRVYKSQPAYVVVITEKEARETAKQQKENPVSGYFLQPGEDPYKKIRENLFVKVQVDKRNCFAGEPVLATFKLYSCLQSKSDIVKNPGFYGFSVFDMVNLSDKEVTAERVNGKLFDVHTIRKVQLFPLRPGTFTIDPMEVRNKVEFSRTMVNKKTEQEIAEGVLGMDDGPENPGAVYYETAISTEPVSIRVRPLPEKNRPDDFGGATGRFSITASLLKDELAINEEGMLEVTLQGTGNFIQLGAPVISWPRGTDGFDPAVKDNFDKSLSPLTGSRTFRFPFVSNTMGENRVPPVQFVYFDTDSNTYKSIVTDTVKFTITEERKINQVAEKKKVSIARINRDSSRIAAAVVAALVLIVLVYWGVRKKESKVLNADPAPVNRPDAVTILQPATEAIQSSPELFYRILYHSIWVYLADNFKLEGTERTKAQLFKIAKQKEIPEAVTQQLAFILSACETGQFTGATPAEDRESLLQQSREVISSLEPYLL